MDRSAHPGSPWAVDALRNVFAATPVGVADVGCGVVAPVLSPSVDWALVVEALERHRVTAIVAPHAAALGCPQEVVAELQQLQMFEVGRGLMLARDTAHASAVLAEAGVEHLVVKGAALAVLVTGRPTGRGGGDIDVWVRPADVVRAEVVLGAAGWVRVSSTLAEPSDPRRWARLLRRGNELQLVQAGGVRTHVDLHWRLSEFAVEFPWGFDEAVGASVAVPEVGPTVRTLGAAHALEHVAQHGRKEMWMALRQVADVARVAQVCGPEVVGESAVRSRNVRLGVALAERLDERLAGWSGPLGRADRRVVDEAWRCCLAFDGYPIRWPDAVGAEAVRRRLGASWWRIRTAPTSGVRWRQAGRLLASVRVVARPHAEFWQRVRGQLQVETCEPRCIWRMSRSTSR